MAHEVSGSRIVGAETNLGSVRERFGGADPTANILGMLTALGALALLSALIGAGAATIDFRLDAVAADGSLQEETIGGAIAGIAVILAAFLVGGWAAGRMARYDGGLNGALTALWFLLLVVLFAALGKWVDETYNAFANTDLPNWVAEWDRDDATLAAIIAGIASIIAAFAGGYLGGRLGEMFHREADAAVAEAARPR
jgi:heme A synthase